MKTNNINSKEVVLKLLFVAIRVAMIGISNGIDSFLRLLKGFIQYVDRSGDENGFGNEIIEHINQYFAITLQLKNLWISDVTYWKPKSFADRISANIHSGKVAVVTGADRDVGQYTAFTLAKFGFKVGSY